MTAGAVILASAGTGKTHRLSGRFIEQLVFHGEPGAILAATFTRSAAGEIMDRVLKRIATTACGETAAWYDPDDRAAVENARRVLTQSIRSLHVWRVSTIDGVLGSLARMLATEIDLAPGWAMIDEDTDRKLRDLAITHAIETSETHDLVALIQSLHEGGASRSVHEAIAASVQTAYDVFLDSGGEADPWTQIGPGDGNPQPPLDSAGRARLRERLLDLEVPTTQAGTPRVHWVNAIARLAAALRVGDTRSIVADSLLERLRDAAPTFSNAEISPEFIAVLSPIADYARDAELLAICGRNRAVWEFMSRFDRAYGAMKRKLGLATFADIPRMLLASEYHGQLDHLYFRLDTRIRDVLLDEFQDTSREQFALLEPLLNEIAGEDGREGRGIMVVGDIKQSLYGWRGASPELLPSLPSRWKTLEHETLVHSYRSSECVLDSVNQVFDTLSTNTALKKHRDAAATWADGYLRHTCAHPDRDGSVTLVEAQPQVDFDVDDETGGTEEAPSAAATRAGAEIVASLVRDPTVGSIGVLVRSNSGIASVMEALAAVGVDASERAGRPLVDSNAVRVLAAALRACEHPGDSAARLLIATSPYAGLFGYQSVKEAIGPSPRTSFGASLRTRYERGGASGVVTWFVRHARSTIGPMDRQRLAALYRVARRWDDGPGASGAGPAACAEAITRSRAVDDSFARVRVMTVHASKGLEFDAVVLPELNASWGLRPNELLVDRPDPIGPLSRISVGGRAELRAMVPEYEDLHARTQARKIGEELSVLYVAMTRAVRHLVMVVQPESTKAKGCSSARVIRAAVADLHAQTEERGHAEDAHSGPAWSDSPSVRVLWTTQSGRVNEEILNDSAETKNSADETKRMIQVRVRHARGREPSWQLMRSSPSAAVMKVSHPDSEQQLYQDSPTRSSTDATALGVALHACFEQIVWLDDLAAEGITTPNHVWDRVRVAVDAEHPWNIDLVERCKVLFMRAIGSPVVRGALSRSRYMNEVGTHGEQLRVDVLNEWGVSARVPAINGHDPSKATDTLVVGRIDRCVLISVPGVSPGGPRKVIRAEILDFKSDLSSSYAGHPADLTSLAERYRGQMRAYQQVVAESFGLLAACVRASVVLIGSARVLEYDPVELSD